MDILLNILVRMQELNPGPFISSIETFYRQHGGLSKKQMEGLHAKASQTEGIPEAWIATLEALIRKKHTKFRSELPVAVKEEPDTESEELINKILEKFPGHKAILMLKINLDKNKKLSPAEKDELSRFSKILLK